MAAENLRRMRRWRLQRREPHSVTVPDPQTAFTHLLVQNNPNSKNRHTEMLKVITSIQLLEIIYPADHDNADKCC